MADQKNKVKRILLMGSFGAGNLGDEGILEAAKAELSKQYKLEKCEHFPFGVRSVFSFKWPRTILKVLRADAVLFPGGGLFAEHESIKAILLWSWQVFCIRLLMTPVFFAGQSVGPFKSKLGKRLTKSAFKKAKFIAMRDAESQALLKQLLPKKEIQLFTDTCFLNKVQPNQSKGSSIALQLRQWNMDLKEIQQQINSLIQKGHEVHFIGSDESDLKVLSQLTGFKSIHLPESFEELIQTLRQHPVAIGMRLHFLIAASLAGCKIHALSYAPKVAALMKELNIPTSTLSESTIHLPTAIQNLNKATGLEEKHKDALAMFKALPL